MMLEVDVESNRILLTEPLLAPPVTNNGEMDGEVDQRRRTSMGAQAADILQGSTKSVLVRYWKTTHYFEVGGCEQRR